jgi:isoleucyl-tRNA synthetase
MGADAMRLYLMKSGLVKGESLNFKDEGVKDIIRDIFLPWYNAYRFLIQNIQRFEKDTKQTYTFDENVSTTQITNLMDLWIMSSSQSLISYVRDQMATYHLDTVAPRLLNFLDELTNWYVRLNRPRIKGE